MVKEKQVPIIFLLIFSVANLLFWGQSHTVQKQWMNVPPVPAQTSVSMIALGDEQLAYRFYATMLQNLGNMDGKQISLKDYNYQSLKNWFFLEDHLDPVSNIIPMIAAYYYGAVKDKEKLGEVLDYLAVVGQRPEGEKWRWLGHAVYLARHEQKDNKRALELAKLLAANKSPDLADWAKQMPVFILQEEGQTELAYKIMLNILISNVDTMHPNEINYMKDYICNTILKKRSDIPKPEFCYDLQE